MMDMQGMILKGVGSFYTILGQDGVLMVCKARGRFRKDGVTPLPGDQVLVGREPGEEYGYLLEILPRKNLLVRPAVANIDQLIVVLSLSKPKPDLLLADKLMLQAELSGITPILVLNKMDEGEQAALEAVTEEYQASGYAMLALSARSGQGIDRLQNKLTGRLSCFAGQSAVGKTSLLNRLLPEADMPVGGLTAKTDRGKHTTRHAQVWPLAHGGAIVDTPGFSLLDPVSLELEELAGLYPEMRAARGNCRFAGCLHSAEPECAVKALLTSGKLSQGRYDRYLCILEYLKKERKHRYD